MVAGARDGKRTSNERSTPLSVRTSWRVLTPELKRHMFRYLGTDSDDRQTRRGWRLTIHCLRGEDN